MSLGGGGGGSTTTTQKADPWVGLQPSLTQLYSGALDQYKTGGPTYYPGSTVAPSNWNIDHALDWGTGLASQGAPSVQSALDQNTATARGDYLNSNPYLDQMYKSATDPMVEQFKNATAPGIASQFSMAGRMGSGAHDQAMGTAETALGRGLGTASADIYGGNYQAERARQQQAIGMAPQLQEAMYAPANKFMQIGQYQQAQQQDAINADKSRFDFGQNRGITNLQQLNQLLQGGAAYAGSSSTGNQSLNRNPFATGLGGAMAGNYLGSQIGAIGGPMGMGIGALLGGLFG